MANVDEGDIVAVVGIEVVRVDEGAFRGERMVNGNQLFGDLRIFHELADLRADELRGGVIRPAIGADIEEGAEQELEATLLPRRLIDRSALFVAHRQCRPIDGVDRQTAYRSACLLINRVVILLDLVEERLVDRVVTCRDGVLRGSLEDVEVAGLLGDHRDRLHTARSGADHADALAGEVHASVGPGTGVVGVALERIAAWDVRDLPGGQAADRGDEELRRDAVALVGFDFPPAGRLVEVSGGHPGLELSVAAEVESIGDVVEVTEDLRLLWVLAAPLPLLHELLVEREAVHVGLGVATGAGVAVPVPGAADVIADFVDLDGHAELVAEAIVHIQTGETGADNDGIYVLGRVR